VLHQGVVDEYAPLVVGDRGRQRARAGLGGGVVAEAGDRVGGVVHAPHHQVALAETGGHVLVEPQGDGVDAVDPGDRLQLICTGRDGVAEGVVDPGHGPERHAVGGCLAGEPTAVDEDLGDVG